MAPASDFLENIYKADSGEAMRRYYDEWADSYDADLDENDYRTPGRCAAALAAHLDDRDAPVLDFACGTGISGVALKEAHLDPGGIFVVSLNDHTLEDPQFEARLTGAVSDGRVEKLMAEDGPHVPGIGLGARVWAVRRL